MTTITIDGDGCGKLYIAIKDKDGIEHKVNQLDAIVTNYRIRDRDSSLPVLNVDATYWFYVGNFHGANRYEVSTNNGHVAMVDADIYYMPKETGRGGFFLNGSFYPVEVVDNVLTPPIISYPFENNSYVPRFSKIADSGGLYLREYSSILTHWQISSDINFENIILESTVVTGRGVDIPDASLLPHGVQHYVRCRHVGTLLPV
mgnify:CR=1 FL=1